MQQVAPDSAFNNALPDDLKTPETAPQKPAEEPTGADTAAAANAAGGVVNSLVKSGALNAFLETEVMSSSNNLRTNPKGKIRRRQQLPKQNMQ